MPVGRVKRKRTVFSKMDLFMTNTANGPIHVQRAETGKSSTANRSVNENAYYGLRADIIEGAHLPGSRLRFEDLRARYGVSTTALREALSRLEVEGLVRIEVHKGARVADVDADDLRDLTSTRQLIEAQAVRQSVEQGGDEWESALVGAFHRYKVWLGRSGGVEERQAAHDAFHEALIAACPSRRLLGLRGLLYNQAERYRNLAFKTVQAEDAATHDEHEQLMKAAVSRRTELAGVLASEHISRAAERLLHRLGLSDNE